MENAANTFDNAAVEYNQQLQMGLELSGESADYFVEGRLQALASLIARRNIAVSSILDFGCGTGNAAELLVDQFSCSQYEGFDCSADSIEIAKRRMPDAKFQWHSDPSSVGRSRFDLVHTTGVFHHVEPKDRDRELSRIFDWLRPGGLFAFFENNPWNPGTRMVMSRIPFDRDAICLSMLESKSRLRKSGFEVLNTRSLFFFPSFLGFLRPLERVLAYSPLGAQYLVLCRRPCESGADISPAPPAFSHGKTVENRLHQKQSFSR